MARSARLTVTDKDCWYFLFARAIQSNSYGALNDAVVGDKLIRLIRLYSQVYGCEIAGFFISKNDFSLVVKFKKFKKLTKNALLNKAIVLYEGRKNRIKFWSKLDYAKFNDRIFDVSEFMRGIQITFSKWLKNHLKIKLPNLWDGRFYSTILANDNVVRDALLYVEAGPFREKYSTDLLYKYFSHSIRDSAKWILPIRKLVKGGSKAKLIYLKMLKHRANLRIRNHDIAEIELKNGYLIGCYLYPKPYFRNGLIIGSVQEIQELINKFRAEGHNIPKTRLSKISTKINQYYLRRKRDAVKNLAPIRSI